MSPWVRRILLVEDDPFAVTLLTSVLKEHGFEVSACSDPGQARAEAKAFDPDVAILDIHLGGEATGLQLGHIIETAHPEVAIMYLTRYPSAVLGDRRYRKHAQGKVVLDKDDVTNAETLIEAIETALRGHEGELPAPVDGGVSSLTPSQMSVLAMMAEGLTNTSIAQRRGTSERAVEKLIEAIYSTLGIEVRGERNARVLAALRYTEVMGHQFMGQQEVTVVEPGR
jgi:DNA-binding NarL/FixJ family response regulator